MADFKAKIHQIRFRLGLRPRPRWGSLHRSPAPVAGFGAASWQGKGLGWGRGGKGRGEGEVEGREREGPQVTVEPGPLRALLRHWLRFLFPKAFCDTQKVLKRRLRPRLRLEPGWRSSRITTLGRSPHALVGWGGDTRSSVLTPRRLRHVDIGAFGASFHRRIARDPSKSEKLRFSGMGLW